MLFSTYGSVLDVVALRTMKMRGQAHITFKDVQTATQAMRALQKFEFFGREMVICSRTDLFLMLLADPMESRTSRTRSLSLISLRN
jgi:RNA recognition motif-containing protein